VTKSRSARFVLLAATSGLALTLSATAFAQAAASSRPSAGQPTSAGSSNAVGGEAQQIPGSPASQDAPALEQPTPTAGGEATTVQEVIVLGVRGAQAAAINVKRIAPQIVDSIVAEDIGKLPDNTIADSLQRIPGVEIDRDAGEGAGVNIRGIPQVLTTLNGEIFLGGGGSQVSVGSDGQSTGGGSLTTAQPSFEDVPAGLFSGVDVVKSPQASDLSGGISGILALKTRRPLDLSPGLTLTGAAQGDYAFVAGKGNQQYNGLIGWNNDGKFGAIFAFSYTDETLSNYHPNVGYQDVPATAAYLGFNPQGGTTLSNIATLGGKDYVYQPIYYALNNTITERQRLGLSSSFQYKFTNALTLTVDLDYLHLDNRNLVEETETQTNGAVNVLQPGAQVSSDGALINGNDLLNHYQSHSENDFTNSDAGDTSFLLTYNPGGRFHGSIRYVGDFAVQNTSNAFADNLATTLESGAVARSPGGAPVSVNPNGIPTTNVQTIIPGVFNSDGTPATQTAASGVLVNVRPSGNYPQLNYITNVSNPANYTMESIWGNGTHTYAQVNVVRADGTYEADLGILKSIDIGARYSERNVKFEAFNYEAGIGGNAPNNQYYFKDPLISDGGVPGPGVVIPAGNYGYSIVPEYPFSSLPAGYVTNATIKGVNQTIPTINPNKMNSAVAFLNTFDPGNVAYDDPAQDYNVNEKETSGYIQGNFEGNTPLVNLPFSGNAGVRVVNTKLSTTNATTNAADYIGSSGSYNGVLIATGETTTPNDYTDVLPEINASFSLTDDMKLRLAYNKAVARQDLGNLGGPFKAYYIVNDGRTTAQGATASTQLFSNASSGNPTLAPFRSSNYQGSYEWYFHKSSLLSIAAFYIDVASFPVSTTLQEAIPDGDGVVRAGGNVSTTINGGGGSIKGVEVGYQQALDFLPGFLKGFGLDANGTYADSETDNVDSAGKKEPLPNNSKVQLNGIVFYQQGPYQGRIAYNWRSTQFVQQYSSGVQNLGIYAQPIGFLDASFSYDVNKHLTFYAQATNITGSDQKRYLEYKDNFYDENVYDTRLFVGVRFRN
jgi:TonB-dependent receptor